LLSTSSARCVLHISRRNLSECENRRLDEEAEKALEQIMRSAGLTISGAFKHGLCLLRDDLVQKAQRTRYEIYAELDLGPGGYATAPSTDTRRGVRAAIKRKLGR
jgi:hypothetical protein